jgi:hypothetical protein
MSKPIDSNASALNDLFSETVKALSAKIASGKASASDLKNAIQLLKDNNVTCEVKKADPFERLSDPLPFTAEPEQ